MANRFSFTKAAIEALPAAAPGSRDRYHDQKVAGLTLRVGPPETGRPEGRRVFYFYKKVAGKVVQSKIGAYPDVSVDVARTKALEAAAAAANRQDPVKAIGRRRLELTVRELFDWWIESYARDRRRTWQEDRRNFERYLKPIANRPLSLLTKGDVRELHARIARDITKSRESGQVKRRGDGRSTANRVMEMLRAVFNQAIKADKFEGPNPCLAIDWFEEIDRDRRLMDHEIAGFMDAVDREQNPDIRDYVLMSIFTGQRQGDVLSARWEQIDLDARLWRLPRTKNGKPHTVYLEDQELELLRARKEKAKGHWVFPGREKGGRHTSKGYMVEPKRGWARILAEAGIEDLRPHDLRRTLGSWMADTGAPLQVIGKALNHQSTSATLIYARLSAKPVRDAKSRALAAIEEARLGYKAPRKPRVRTAVVRSKHVIPGQAASAPTKIGKAPMP